MSTGIGVGWVDRGAGVLACRVFRDATPLAFHHPHVDGLESRLQAETTA